MAKKKSPELSPETQAANTEGLAKREKEKQSRQKNAEKQKRFREGMKETGYKHVTLWEPPNLPGAWPYVRYGVPASTGMGNPLKPGEKPDKNKVRYA